MPICEKVINGSTQIELAIRGIKLMNRPEKKKNLRTLKGQIMQKQEDIQYETTKEKQQMQCR
jgi:hypothetical protein